MPGSSTYDLLSAPFEHTFTDVRGGVELTYLTGEQVATRLNRVLGVGGWSFRVLRHDVNVEADEAWALGEIVPRSTASVLSASSSARRRSSARAARGCRWTLGST